MFSNFIKKITAFFTSTKQEVDNFFIRCKDKVHVDTTVDGATAVSLKNPKKTISQILVSVLKVTILILYTLVKLILLFLKFVFSHLSTLLIAGVLITAAFLLKSIFGSARKETKAEKQELVEKCEESLEKTKEAIANVSDAKETIAEVIKSSDTIKEELDTIEKESNKTQVEQALDLGFTKK